MILLTVLEIKTEDIYSPIWKKKKSVSYFGKLDNVSLMF